MKEFENIAKRMPYAESEDYVQQLGGRATENDIAQARKPKAKTRPLHWMAAAAAITALMALAGITYYGQEQQTADALTAELTTDEDMGPIDEFLDNLTDEEAQLLAYYDIDEIPEYD